MPRLPRKVQLHVSKCCACHSKQLHVVKCHACHAKRRGATAPHLKPSAPPMRATPATQSHGGCHQVPRLPRKVTVDIAKCQACHAKRRGATAPHLKPSAPPEPAQCHKCHDCHAKCSYMSPSAVPATQSAATCRQVPRLPRKTPRRHGATPKTKRATTAQCHKCHACHAKCSYMSPSAVPATQSAATCRQVSRLPRKTPRRHGATPKTKRATRASPVP